MHQCLFLLPQWSKAEVVVASEKKNTPKVYFYIKVTWNGLGTDKKKVLTFSKIYYNLQILRYGPWCKFDTKQKKTKSPATFKYYKHDCVMSGIKQLRPNILYICSWAHDDKKSRDAVPLRLFISCVNRPQVKLQIVLLHWQEPSAACQSVRLQHRLLGGLRHHQVPLQPPWDSEQNSVRNTTTHGRETF